MSRFIKKWKFFVLIGFFFGCGSITPLFPDPLGGCGALIPPYGLDHPPPVEINTILPKFSCELFPTEQNCCAPNSASSTTPWDENLCCRAYRQINQDRQNDGTATTPPQPLNQQEQDYVNQQCCSVSTTPNCCLALRTSNPSAALICGTPPGVCPVPAAAVANVPASDPRCSFCASNAALWSGDPACVVTPGACPIPTAAAANIPAGDIRCTRCASDPTLWSEDRLCVDGRTPPRICSLSGATGLLVSSPLCRRCANPPASFTGGPDSLGLWAGDPTCPTAATTPCPLPGIPAGVMIGDARCVAADPRTPQQDPVAPTPTTGLRQNFELECDCADSEDHFPKEITPGVKACFGVTKDRKPAKAFCRLKEPAQGATLNITKAQILANIQKIEWKQISGSSPVLTSASAVVAAAPESSSSTDHLFSISQRTNEVTPIKDQAEFQFPAFSASMGSGKSSENFKFVAIAYDINGRGVWAASGGSIDMVLGVQGGGCGSCSIGGALSAQNILANLFAFIGIVALPFFKRRFS